MAHLLSIFMAVNIVVLGIMGIGASKLQAQQHDTIEFTEEENLQDSPILENLIIQDIVISGNRIISSDAIATKIPFKVGDIFKRNKTAALINAIYSLQYFRNIKVELEYLDPVSVRLHVIVTEKDKVSRFNFAGNHHLKESEIEKKLNLLEIKTLDEEDLKGVIEQIRKLYQEKDYHHIKIQAALKPDGEHAVIAHIDIDEGCKSHVNRVFFKGNVCIPSKKLRTLIFTREDWIFGFFDKSGSYQPDAIEYDKHVIENYYHSNGFLMAQVTDVVIDEDPCTNLISVTYNIDEGPLYYINEVYAVGNDCLTEEQILGQIAIKPGHIYSKERIRQTLEKLRLIWGEYGYIYADVQPIVRPDQTNQTVSLGFQTDLGNKITTRRINIFGNRKTRDKVIRRELLVMENQLLTTFKMDQSKYNVERLGYFDQKNGVNWRTTRVDDESVDLDLMLKEVKTGQFFFQVGFGGAPEDFQSPTQTARVSVTLQDQNFLGRGIAYSANGQYSRQDMSISGALSNPWMFDRPINGSIEGYHRRTNYEDFINVNPIPTEQISGGFGALGFMSPRLGFARIVFDSGIEKICYPQQPRAGMGVPPALRANFQEVLNDRFIPGTLAWAGFSMMQDVRNHPTFPTRGHYWIVNTKFALPNLPGNFGFAKFDTDFHWYTPLIEEYSLIFHLHGHLGWVHAFDNHNIPYRELYNIGGVATVRGFKFGQIGPSLLVQDCNNFWLDSIGGTKAFWTNVELLFPITRDYSMRGVIFYDGGAGWDTPHANRISKELLRNNKLQYRHAIGFGVRMLYPTPIRFDWGFKLDRNKRLGETVSEVHLTALHEF